MVEFVFQRGTDKTFEQQYYEYLQNVNYIKSIKSQSEFDKFRYEQKEKIIQNKTIINNLGQNISTDRLEKLIDSGFDSLGEIMTSSFLTLETQQKEVKSIISDIHSFLVEMDQSTKKYINQIVSYLKLPDSEKKIKSDLEKAIEFFNVSGTNPKYLEYAVELFNDVLQKDNTNIIANYYMGIIKMSVPEYLNLEMSKVHLELANFFALPLLKNKSSQDAKKLYENILISLLKNYFLNETPDLAKIKSVLDELETFTIENIRVDYYNLLYHIKNGSDYDTVYEAFVEFIHHNKDFAKIKCLSTKDIYEYSKFNLLIEEFDSEVVNLLITFKNNALQRIWQDIPKEFHKSVEKFFREKGPSMSEKEIEYFHTYDCGVFILRVKPFIDFEFDESKISFDYNHVENTYKELKYKNILNRLYYLGIGSILNLLVYAFTGSIFYTILFFFIEAAISYYLFDKFSTKLFFRIEELNWFYKPTYYSRYMLGIYSHTGYSKIKDKANDYRYKLNNSILEYIPLLTLIKVLLLFLIFLI